MKYLTDSYIIDWNKRLKDSPYMVTPMTSNNSSFFEINLSYKPEEPTSMASYPSTIRPLRGSDTLLEGKTMSYEISFSVVKNREEEFFDLLDIIFNRKLGTKCNGSIIQMPSKEEINISKKSHIVNKREFIRYTYKFNYKITGIIGYVSYLEDTINFFGMMWGYDDDGNEVSLTDFKIGDIVSLKDERTGNYLVIDYVYIMLGDKYTIDYELSEIKNKIDSHIIEYGSAFSAGAESITYNRDNRINDILDKNN